MALKLLEMSISEDLRLWRKNVAGVTQEEMASKLGLERHTYKNYEYDGYIPEPVLQRLRVMGFNPADEQPKTRKVLSKISNIVTHPYMRMRYAGELPAGEWADPLNSEEFEEVDAGLWKANRWCARIIGRSCYPALQPGDFCIFERNLAPQYGKIVVAQRKDHAATIKQLLYDADKRAPILHAINSEEHEDAECEEGWGAIAMLVHVRWFDQDGGAWAFTRDDGIRAEQLIRNRPQY
jgi:SOS-response transcriptional repressor LexA